MGAVGHGFGVIGKFAEDVGHMAVDWTGVGRMMGYAEKTQGGARNLKEFAEEVWGADKEGLTTFMAGNKRYSGARIAGTVAGLGVGYRALSGGGIYRDKNGNTDIAGIPFI